MAWFTGPQFGPEESYLQYEELMRAQAQAQRAALQQAGYREEERRLTLKEGLKQATPTQRATHERAQKGREAAVAALARYGITEQAAFDPALFEEQVVDPFTGTRKRTGARDYIPEWLDQIREAQKIEDKLLVTTEFVKTPELLEQERIQRESLARQRELETAIIERQLAAQRGELELSPAAEQRRQRQFETFKEAQARAGRIILGETPEEAIAKGTAAEQALSGFKEQLQASREAERQAAITQAPQAFAAAQLAGTIAPGYFQPATLPTQPSPLGLEALQTALQPFQYQQQIALQQAQLAAQQREAARSRRTGLLGAGIGALGTIGGAALGSLLMPTPTPTV